MPFLTKYRAPASREMWFGWPDTPRPSNVTSVSIGRWPSAAVLKLVIEPDSSEAIKSSGQTVDMESGSRGWSCTATVSFTFATPRRSAEARSSVRRVAPMPSALPIEKQIMCSLLFADGCVSACSVGAKNMASSSGWAMRRAIERLRITSCEENWQQEEGEPSQTAKTRHRVLAMLRLKSNKGGTLAVYELEADVQLAPARTKCSDPPGIDRHSPAMARQRKNNKPKPARVDSDSDNIEEIPRKTLLEHLEATHAKLNPGVPFDITKLDSSLGAALSKETKDGITFTEYNIPTGMPQRDTSGKKKLVDEIPDEEEEAEVIGDAGQAFFFAIPLMMLLSAFHILVQKQYLQEMDYWEIVSRSVKSFIPIWFIVYLTHPRRDIPIIQAIFTATAIGSGCWMVYNVNMHGYYAIMKMVPPLGTLLVYAVIQMDLLPAVLSLAAIGGYIWYNDFAIFTRT
ncbi:hypothetical protein Dda_2739 [Drechslerella dactyloides]|uniref:DUF7719 domain-containing protein n=1 Tax=Drechslerella dactyloides TaxID=74499 RepID=A0AAD6NL53_DREDA|nr:hypothetical protein Dda_2739 [Drechslerella dactyloides]